MDLQIFQSLDFSDELSHGKGWVFSTPVKQMGKQCLAAHNTHCNKISHKVKKQKDVNENFWHSSS